MSVRKLPTGVTRHRYGFRVKVSRGRGLKPATKYFPKGTPDRVMIDWREDTLATTRIARKQRASAGTFEGDALKYLDLVSTLDSIKERRRLIHLWIGIFGTRQRDTITAAEIRLWRNRWATEPRGNDDDGAPLEPYAANTINQRLRALSNLWTVLDGRRAPNPVREVPEVEEPDALPRGIAYEVVQAILDRLIDRGRFTRGVGTKPQMKAIRAAVAAGKTAPELVPVALPKSKTRVRLFVMAYTGLTPSQLGRIRPEDLDLKNAAMLVRRRRKGKGAKARRKGLLPQAIAAFDEFVALNCFGKFSPSSVRKSFLIACRKARADGFDVPDNIRPYDLRHSMGTAVYKATGSLRVVQELLSHEKLSTTERYVLAGVPTVQAQQMQQIIDSGLIPTKATRATEDNPFGL